MERGAREACPIYGMVLGSPPAGQARYWRLFWAIWVKAEKLRYGNPTRGGLPGWGRQEQGLWRPQPHNAVLEASLTPGRLFLSVYSLSLPPPCPVPGSPGGWARGAAGGAAGGSGGLRGGSRACSGAGSRAAATAAARSAPRPPLHQSFKSD